LMLYDQVNKRIR